MAKKIIFELPSGVQVPDGKQAGDTFQAMGTFLLMAGNKAELTEVDGDEIDGATPQGDAPNTEDEDDSTQPMSVQDRMMGAMGGGQ